MATSKEMIELMAAAFGEPVSYVTVVDRALGDAGLRNRGKRGAGAVHMRAEDVAHLLIAVAGRAAMKDAADYVTMVSQAPLRKVVARSTVTPDLSSSVQLHSAMEHEVAQRNEATVFAAGNWSTMETELKREKTFGAAVGLTLQVAAAGVFPVTELGTLQIKFSFPYQNGDIGIRRRGEEVKGIYGGKYPLNDEQAVAVFSRSWEVRERLLFTLTPLLADSEEVDEIKTRIGGNSEHAGA